MKVIGLYKKTSTYQLASLYKQGGAFIIECLEEKEKLAPFDKGILKVTGIEGQDLLIRHLKSPLKEKRSLQKTLPFQLETLIPYSLNEVIVKPIYIRRKQETHAIFFTVLKKHFKTYLQQKYAEGIDPEWVSVVPIALFRFGQFIIPQDSSFLVFYVGKTSIQLTSIKEEMVKNHLTIHIGERDILNAYKLDNVSDFLNVHEKKTPHLFNLLIRFNQEIDRAFSFLKRKDESVCRVLFCGTLTDQIEKIITKNFSVSSIEVSSDQGYDGTTIRSFAISIGLALDALINDKKSIQIRQGEYISEPCYKKIKKGMITGGVLGGVLCILTICFSLTFFDKKQNQLSQQLENLMNEYKEDMPALKEVKLAKGLEKKLNIISDELYLPKNSDRYFTPPPLVSDFLAFIATYPKLKGIELVQIDYTLESYPTLDSPQTKYAPKVRIVFKTEEAKKAREFHDAIFEEQRVININNNIEWNRKENEYEITFFLQT